MKVTHIQSLVLAFATAALLGGTSLAAGGPGPQQPPAGWVRQSATLSSPPRTVQTGNTTVALTGHRYTTEEDVATSRRAGETRRPQFTNFGQGNNTVR